MNYIAIASLILQALESILAGLNHVVTTSDHPALPHLAEAMEHLTAAKDAIAEHGKDEEV